LQHGEKFGLPFNSNKKTVIHEFIKDIEGNANRVNVHKQIKIRNIATAQLNQFLHRKTQKIAIDNNILSMVKSTIDFMHNNSDIIFRADKGNVTVALNKNVYIEKIEELLHDKETLQLLKEILLYLLRKTLKVL